MKEAFELYCEIKEHMKKQRVKMGKRMEEDVDWIVGDEPFLSNRRFTRVHTITELQQRTRVGK